MHLHTKVTLLDRCHVISRNRINVCTRNFFFNAINPTALVECNAAFFKATGESSYISISDLNTSLKAQISWTVLSLWNCCENKWSLRIFYLSKVLKLNPEHFHRRLCDVIVYRKETYMKVSSIVGWEASYVLKSFFYWCYISKFTFTGDLAFIFQFRLWEMKCRTKKRKTLAFLLNFFSVQVFGIDVHKKLENVK